MTNMFRPRTPWRRYWSGLACCCLVAVIGEARVYRAAALAAPINAGVSPEIRLDNALVLTRRVAERFRYIEEHGPIGEAAPWPLRTDADYLLTGGDCGRAAGALASVFVARGRQFHVIQVNVGPRGAGHIMFETPDGAGRWVLLDPLAGRGFAKSPDGALMGIDEIRALPPAERDWLPREYQDGDRSLFNPYRRTNWTRLGPIADLVRAAKGDSWMTETSLRAVIADHERRGADAAVVVTLLLACAGVIAARSSGWERSRT